MVIHSAGSQNGAPTRQRSIGDRAFAELLLPEVEANPKGYNFQVHVTKGHEHEAMEAQRRKKPSRTGKWILKLLGFKGEVGSDHVE
jgi:hypothetical protein